MKAAKRLSEMGSYVMADLQKQAREQEKRTGKPIVNLTLGNPGFPVADEVKNKMSELCQEAELFRYPGYRTIPAFSEAVHVYYQKRFHVELQNPMIIPLLGVKDAVSHLPLALLDPGDEALVPDPGFTYASDTILAGSTPVPYSLNAFMADPHSAFKKISEKTKILWMNFPSNPTGQMVDLLFYQKVVDLALKYGILVINDNPYVNITWDGVVAPSIMQVKGAERTAIEFMSLSKDYSLAGLRIGYAVGHAETLQAFSKLKNQVDAGMCLLHQEIAAFCLDQVDQDWQMEWSEKRNDYYRNNCHQLADFLEEKLKRTVERPKGGLYLWFDVPDGYETGEIYAQHILKEKSILLVPGSVYGQEGKRFVRASFAYLDL